MAETVVTITERRRYSRGRFFGETGKFEKPETNDIVVLTKLRKLVFFNIVAVDDLSDRSAVIHRNSNTASAVEDDLGQAWIDTSDLSEDTYLLYEAVGVR